MIYYSKYNTIYFLYVFKMGELEQKEDQECIFNFVNATLYCTGFPQRLKKLENNSSHGKVIEHEKLAKSPGIFCPVMEFD